MQNWSLSFRWANHVEKMYFIISIITNVQELWHFYFQILLGDYNVQLQDFLSLLFKKNCLISFKWVK